MTITCRDREAHARGFSLAELLVVLAIIATLSAIAAPRYAAAAARYRVDAAVRALSADVTRIRRQAAAESCSYSIKLGVGDRWYTVTTTTGPNAGVGTAVRLLEGPEPVVVVASTFGASDTVTIDPFGAATPGGSVVLYASGLQATLVIASGRAASAVATVTASTGATASSYATIAAASLKSSGPAQAMAARASE